MEPIPEGRKDTAASAGAWLRNARQQRGLHIAALAVMLKVPQTKLEALEGDRYDELPDATFARALATAMCRALKVDPAPALALLPRSEDRGLEVPPGLNQPFRERGSMGDGVPLAALTRPVVWGPLLLLGAAAAIYWVPAGWLPERGGAASAPVAANPLPAASEPAGAEAVAASAATAAADVGASAPAVVAASAAPAQPPREVVTPGATASAASMATQPPAATSGPLRVTATAETWVEVVDAQGRTLLSSVLKAGDQKDIDGAAPFKLRIGNVSGTHIEWRGAAIDLGARSKDNVARLELN